MDPERHAYANRVLANDAQFQALRSRFNVLGVLRFLVYLVTGITALVSGVNQAYGWLVGACVVGFLVVMIIEYNRAAIRARQQGRALYLGVITEDDLR